ncbi:Toll-Like Receptor 3 [Manis pentadactyla]|nr:Toll-Like Receptor 3 [Manis pentadactyla]
MPWAAPPPASCAPQKTTTRAVVVWSSLAPYDAVGGTDDGISPNCKADDDLMGLPLPRDTAPPSMAVIFHLPPAPHEAVGSSTFGPRAGNDTQDEPMDTTPPSMAVIFRWTPAPHGAMRSTTAGLLCTSDNHRTGGRRLISPRPLRCSGRHRRRPWPYP